MAQKTKQKKELFVLVSEAAEILQVGEGFIENLANKGAIPWEERDGNLYVEVYFLNQYIDSRKRLKKSRKPNRLQEMENTVNQTNSLVASIGKLLGDVIDSFAELGSMIPFIEIMVTFVAFYGAGLSDVYGYEVMVGFVIAQIAALYLTAHYKDMAMHWLGDTVIFLSVFGGAINTGIAIYLALAVANDIDIPQPIIFVPAFSSAFGVLFIYLAKLFTHARQSTRVQKRHEAKEALKSFQRKAASERQRTATLDKMQNTRLKMEADALQELATDPRIQTIQKKAMWLTVVGEIMKQYDINPRSRLGKELLQLANEGTNPEPDFELPPLFDEDGQIEPDFLPSRPTAGSNGYH